MPYHPMRHTDHDKLRSPSPSHSNRKSLDGIFGEIIDASDQLGLEQVHSQRDPTSEIFVEARDLEEFLSATT